MSHVSHFSYWEKEFWVPGRRCFFDTVIVLSKNEKVLGFARQEEEENLDSVKFISVTKNGT